MLNDHGSKDSQSQHISPKATSQSLETKLLANSLTNNNIYNQT